MPTILLCFFMFYVDVYKRFVNVMDVFWFANRS